MKRELIGIFLAAAFVPSVLSGCGRDVSLNSQVSDTLKAEETTDNIETTEAETEEVTTEISTESQSDFDFVKTVEFTYICGQKLSYPITWGQFGEDFTINLDSLYIDSKNQKVTCDVNYKNNYLGHFIFYGCDSVETITEETVITAMFIDNDNLSYFDVPTISVNNVTIDTYRTQLYDTLGDDYREGVTNSQIIYEDDNGKYIFSFNPYDEEDKIISVDILNLKK